MRFRSETDEDRRPLVEDGDRAAQIHQLLDVLVAPRPTVGRSSASQARWNAFLVTQAPPAVAR